MYKKIITVVFILITITGGSVFAASNILEGASAVDEQIIELFFNEYSTEIDNYNDILGEKLALEKQIEIMEATIDNKSSELNTKGGEIEVLENQNATLINENELLLNDNTTLKEEVSSLESQVEQLQEESEEDDSQEQDVNSSALNSKLISLEEEIQILKNEISILDGLEEELANKDATITSLNNDLSVKSDEIDRLSDLLNNEEVEDNQENKPEKDDFSEQIKAKDEEIEQLKDKSEGYINNIQNLEDEVEDLKDTISRDEGYQNIEDLKDKLENAEENVDYYKEALIHGLQNNKKIIEVTKEVEVEVESKGLIKENKLLKSKVLQLERKVEILTKANNNGLEQEELKYTSIKEEEINKKTYEGRRDVYYSRLAKTMNKLYKSKSKEPEAIDLSDCNFSFRQWTYTDISSLPYRELFYIRGYYDEEYMLDYVVIERR